MIIINDNFIIPFLSLNDFLSDTHDRVKFRLEWSLEQKKAGLQNNTLEKNLSIGTRYPKKPFHWRETNIWSQLSRIPLKICYSNLDRRDDSAPRTLSVEVLLYFDM